METNTDGTAIETIRLFVEEMPCDHSEITAGKTLIPSGVEGSAVDWDLGSAPGIPNSGFSPERAAGVLGAVGYRTHEPSGLAKPE